MAITYTWSITSMTCDKQIDGFTDYVVAVNWICAGVEDGYSAEIRCASMFKPSSGQQFTPYNELTEGQVLTWVWAATDKDVIEGSIAQLIKQKKFSPTVDNPLPWGAA